MIKPISISLSPNVQKDDVRLALKLITTPWRWKKGEDIALFEKKFKEYIGVQYAYSFNSGRSAMMALLNSANLPKDKEVLAQAFTCNAAINPVLWSGLKPRYVDCLEETFNMDVEDLKKKINDESGAVMIQHTFGLPADIDGVKEASSQNNLFIIEDCAHALGSQYHGKKVGTFGDAAFFSFSRDKAISCVYGGMAVTDRGDLGEKIGEYYDSTPYPSSWWIFQQLLHPILLYFIVIPLYRFFDLGKLFLLFSQATHLLSKAIHWREKKGEKPYYFPQRLPNALALLALNQLEKIDRFYTHRKKIAEYYRENLRETSLIIPQHFSEDYLGTRDMAHNYLRFTVCHPKAHALLRASWKQNILLGDWYSSPIFPRDTSLEAMHYRQGECPVAEKLARSSLNLPTHINITLKEASRVVEFLKKNLSKHDED